MGDIGLDRDQTAVLLPLDSIVVPEGRMRRLLPEKVEELVESIARQGLIEPICVQPRGAGRYRVIAGRHRFDAVKCLKWPSIRATIADVDDATAKLMECDENLVRADLSPGERGEHLKWRKLLYEKLHPETKHGAAGRGRGKNRQIGGSIDRFTKDAAKKTGKSERTIQREIERATKITVLSDIIGTTLDQGDELDALAKLPPVEQQKLAALAKSGERVTAKHVAQKLRREEREHELAAATLAASAALGKKLYGVLYVDPPWEWTAYSSESGLLRAPQAHYPVMSIDEITAMTIPAAQDAVLFLWVPRAHLASAIDVMRAWGFTFKTDVVWEKTDGIGLGYWFRDVHEHLLVGVRGNKVPAPVPGEQPPSLIKTPRGRHSEKPAIFAELIEKMFPTTPRIEMFARTSRPGWDSWGNEAGDPAAAASCDAEAEPTEAKIDDEQT